MVAKSAEFLRRHGVSATFEELDEALTRAIASRRVMLRELAPSELTDAEIEVLREGGLAVEPRFPPGQDPLTRSIGEFAALIKTSVGVAAAARRLGVDPSRIRQRLGERSLYGLRPDGEWLLPAFQFDGDRLVPGIGEALRRLDPKLHPLEIEAFFLEPNEELAELRDGDPISPRDWLLAGLDPAAVAQLAAEL